jgi:hypothetical protein
VACLPVEAVVVEPAIHPVIAVASPDNVITALADLAGEKAGPVLADGVLPIAAIELVVLPTAKEDVVAGISPQAVQAIAALETITAAAT